MGCLLSLRAKSCGQKRTATEALEPLGSCSTGLRETAETEGGNGRRGGEGGGQGGWRGGLGQGGASKPSLEVGLLLFDDI